MAAPQDVRYAPNVGRVGNPPYGKGHLWLAAGLLVFGGVMSWWIAGAMPSSHRGPRLAVPRGEPLNAPLTVTPGMSKPGLDKTVVVSDGDFTTLTFDLLGSFYYELPDPDAPKGPEGIPQVRNQIPTPIREQSGKRVAIQGFMVPLVKEKGGVKAFMLLKDRSLCCFGRTPRMNEWVYVSMANGETTRFVNDVVVTVFGTLAVGEAFEKGELMNIYRIAAEQVAAPLAQ